MLFKWLKKDLGIATKSNFTIFFNFGSMPENDPRWTQVLSDIQEKQDMFGHGNPTDEIFLALKAQTSDHLRNCVMNGMGIFKRRVSIILPLELYSIFVFPREPRSFHLRYIFFFNLDFLGLEKY